MNTVQDEYTEGWTAPIEYDLKHKDPGTGAISSFNATGMTPSLVLTDKDGNVIAFAGTVEWANAATSRIRFNPGAADLKASLSPYKLHWKVTDLSSKIAFYPQGTPIQIKVYAP